MRYKNFPTPHYLEPKEFRHHHHHHTPHAHALINKHHWPTIKSVYVELAVTVSPGIFSHRHAKTTFFSPPPNSSLFLTPFLFHIKPTQFIMDNPQKDRTLSQQQKEPLKPMIHSTHSNLETFDQATREQRLHSQQRQKSVDMNSNSSSTPTSPVDAKRPELEINSAVQLDRDVQGSRRTADENRQKARTDKQARKKRMQRN